MLPSRRQALSLALLPVLPAQATPQALEAAVRRYVGTAPLQDGRVEIDIAELVENGNTVPVTLRMASPMTADDHVRSLALFTERNPQPEVAVFHLTRHNGRAEVHTRIRLATSQQLVALATTNDGRCWRRRVEVLVTLAACIE